MKISPISFSKINNTNNNLKTKTCTQKPLCNSSNDIFVKSNSNISFGARNIDDKYIPFKNDLIQYVLQNNDYNEKDIEKIFQKYSPTTSFKDFSNLPKTANAHEATAGYTEQKIAFMLGYDGKPYLEKLPKTVYMMFPKTNSFDDKIIFLDRTLHESTHVFNADNKKGSCGEELMENYIKNASDIQKAVRTMQISQQIFTSIEKESLYLLANTKRMTSLPKSISEVENLDKLFIKNYNLQAYMLTKQLIDSTIKKVSMICDFDKKFVIDYIASKADEEKQAYQNALDSTKSLLGIKGKTDFDLRIELYDSIIKSAQKLR